MIMVKSRFSNAFYSIDSLMRRKTMECQNDDFNIKMNMIPMKMIRKYKAVTLKRSIQKIQ